MARLSAPVSDLLIERAVELWCRALRSPKFDNGDNSERGFFASGLAGINSDAAAAEVDEFDQAVGRFRKILVDKLKTSRDKNGQPTGEEGPRGPRHYYFDPDLRTDYRPEDEMAEAATEAGIPHNLFSWKSSVHLYWPDAVCASFGYGAPEVYHYPLSGGRWLITMLRGQDMPSIIKAVEEGRLPEFQVEEWVPANG